MKIWKIDELESALQSDALNETGIYNIKEFVDFNDIVKEVIILENKRITDNNDYISIPIKDWLTFKELLSQKNDKVVENKYKLVRMV